ncbi:MULTISPECIES: GntR family transcriptional regulator [Streptomyces]|uniref:DNA-binding GntR family transcriptional regulator n=1 Tax=Streptomyces clavifer TaxID=68188 RepID=A0ABS4V4L5_9ACTN|nr:MULTISPECIES: GntR family transcriptional regulator [Streptomyces]KQX80916.1 GntR family transcriptional regulator [Streptomyces sp. Root1319]KQZ07113.1 GntR family transcriptional regulator [Streptomyces sp. Root55]MBP2358855.1 DNA-binding GntR family transcriptional regulator [Streptomyces clavifer]MDX2745534.1 GntR family transcriptional regulator [Streptomyces sp. NRRL_B-2557]MDX3065959.1 GntR family transcriptional regulator [Streptomyces sp. ND04-05B]
MESAAQPSGPGRRSLRDHAYETLRRRIIEVELRPGERLVERDLATELRVSRIPLREALRLLAAEGLVLLVPHRGALVAPFTPSDVRDLFDVRESLESLAARLAAERADEEGLRRLAARLDAARTATREHDRPTIAAANAAFHTDIVDLAANALLSGVMRPLEARMHWLFHLTAQRDPAQQCAEHERLYEAIAARDGDRAARLAHEHVADGRPASLALAARWSMPDIDPEAIAARRRRGRAEAGKRGAAGDA